MLSYFDAAINGRWLSDVDESVYVIDVKEQSKEQTESVARTMVSGSRFIRKIRHSLSVIISFYITEREPQRRADVLQYVQEWALSGNQLEVDYRNGQRLIVVCDNPTALSSANAWTELLTITFSAYEFPYWVDQTGTTVTTSGSGQMRPSGQYQHAPCDVSVTNKGSSAITNMIIRSGETSITFDGISLPAGGKLEIVHSLNGLLSAKIGGQSILANRTDSSSDDLLVSGGRQNDISVSADQAVSAVFVAWGVHL